MKKLDEFDLVVERMDTETAEEFIMFLLGKK